MIIDRIALVLAIIGGINWGSIGLFRFDLVAFLFGGQTAMFSRIIHTGGIGCRLVYFPAVPKRTGIPDGISRPNRDMINLHTTKAGS